MAATKKQWLDLVRILAPMILMMTPGIPPILIPSIIAGVAKAEEFDGIGLLPKPEQGAAKKKIAMELVGMAITGVNSGSGGEKVNAVQVNQAISSGIDTTIAVIKLMQRGSAGTGVPVPSPVPPVV